jgi:hypothetical protein
LRKNGQATRCRSGHKIKKKKPAATNAAPDFLKQTFYPVTDQNHYKRSEIQSIQESFCSSLHHLGALYQFKPLILPNQVYPYNIHAALSHARKIVGSKSKDLELQIIETEVNPASIVSVREIEIGHSLYYVPVEPLLYFHFVKKKPAFDLLLSIYAYLNQCTGMPLPNQNDYIRYNYEMIGDWVAENESDRADIEAAESGREFRCLNRKIAILEKAVKRKENVRYFGKRLKTFQAKDFDDIALYGFAKRFYELYNRFPKAHFIQNIEPTDFQDADEDDYPCPMYPDQYYSFCWGSKGWIFNQLMEIVNSELQECTVCEQPTSVQHFDAPQQKEVHGLEFEKELLNLLSDFLDFLETLYNENYNE